MARRAPATLSTEDARVLHPDGRALSYAQLAARAAKLVPPSKELRLKAAKRFQVIGRPVQVADGRDIVTGVAAYGLDAYLPNALTAVIARCPYFDGAVASVDDAAARRIPGVRNVIVLTAPKPDAALDRNLAAGVAVVADDLWSALKGRDALVIHWTRGPWAKDSTGALERRAHAALDVPLPADSPGIARRDGDFAAARASAARTVEARYTLPFLAHATLEPPSALARLEPRRALLIASLQSPGDASRLISAMTGIPRLAIDIRLPRSGGGFGRRLESDFIAETVLVAQAAKAPIKLVWTREDDLANDFYRPFGVHALTAALDARGMVTGWAHRVAATSRRWRAAGLEEAPAWVACADPDGFPAGGVAAYVAEFVPLDFGLARGWWRAPLPTFVAFPVQSFVSRPRWAETAHGPARSRAETRRRGDRLRASTPAPARHRPGGAFHLRRLCGARARSCRLG
ncbi:MAG: molybdopterin cofactor-binding domain-containing protein [Gammaproteobacteria bacterium]